MADLNFTSLQDTIVPPVYIEEVTVSYPSDSELNTFDEPGIRFLDRYGKEKYTTLPIVSEQQQIENVIAVDTKVFLMLSEEHFKNLNDDVNIYVVIADTNQKINLLRNGEYTFDELQTLLANDKILFKTIGYQQIVENIVEVMSNNTRYYKLTADVRIQAKEVPNLAVFTFMTVPTKTNQNKKISLAAENILYGKLNGELVLRDGVAFNEQYYFLDSSNLIWAGAVNEDQSQYTEGLKKNAGNQRNLTPQKTEIYKTIDKRTSDIETVFDRIVANFNFIQETTILQDNVTSELLSFTSPAAGISPVISSIVKEKDLQTANKVAKNTSNLIFIDPQQVLRKNSIYSSLLDRLSEAELDYVLKATHIDSFEVERVLVSGKGEIQEEIISTSFKPGDMTGQSKVRNIANSSITSEPKYATYAYYEDVNDNLYGTPFKKYKAVSFTDQVPPLYRKSDFYYRVRFDIKDGLRSFILQKIQNIKSVLGSFKREYSKLNNPTLYDSAGDFNDRAREISNSQALVEIIGIMVSALEFFFDLSQITTSVNLLRGLYYASNTETGNIYEMRKVYDSYEKLYLLLAQNFGVPEIGSGAGSIVAENNAKEPKSINIEIISKILNLNFDDHVGVKYFNTYDQKYRVNGLDSRISVFLPTIGTEGLNSLAQPRLDSTLSSPTVDNTYYSFYKPYSIFLDKDYLIRKNTLSGVENNTQYTQYLSILLSDSIQQTVYDKYSGQLPFSTTNNRQKAKVSVGKKDKTYQRYVRLLENLSDIGISIDVDLDDYAINNNINKNRLEVENEEQKSKLVDLDTISSKLPLSLSKIIQNTLVSDVSVASIRISDSPNPFASLISSKKANNVIVPFQFTSLADTGNDLLLYRDNNILRLFDTDNLAYYYYNYSLLGNVKVLTGFEEESMVPIYQDLTLDILNEQNLGENTKYICKIERFSDNDLLSGLFDKVNVKTIENNVMILQNGPDSEEVEFSKIINLSTITEPEIPTYSNNVAQEVENLKNINNIGINKFEKYFSSSLFITQPQEVLELRFEFDRPTLTPPPVVTENSEIAQTTAATPSNREIGY